MNPLNEEIRCLRSTINEKRRMMNLQPNQSKKEELRREIMKLQLLLNDKLAELLYLEEGL